MRSSKARAKSLVASRLSACADVLLKAVQVGVRKFRYKTVKALFEHILQTLPSINDGYCEPLVPNYFKVLRIVLEYPPHPEHLTKHDWHEVADFCNEAVHDLNTVLAESEPSLSHRVRESSSFGDTLSRSVTPNGHGHSLGKISSHETQRSSKLCLKASDKDILLCVRYLHRTPNAPIGEKAQARLQNLTELLHLSSNVGHAQHAAFDCINSIVARIVTDDVGLAQDALRSLIPTMCRFWQLKSSSLKDSMLILLLHSEQHFKGVVQSDKREDFNTELQNLLEAFKEDYCKRPEREQLQIEDLDLANVSYDQEHESPLRLRAFRARCGAVKAEQPWALLEVSRSIISALNLYLEVQDEPTTGETHNHVAKRRKVHSSWDSVLLRAKTSKGTEKLHAIQIIAFLLDSPVDDNHTAQHFLDVLLFCLSDTNSTVVSWAMLAMSR